MSRLAKRTTDSQISRVTGPNSGCAHSKNDSANSGLAKRCEIQFAYAIGYPDPVSVCIDTFGTGIVDDEKIAAAAEKVFSFKPANIVRQLKLLRPIYSKTTNYGHFGKTDDLNTITWEKTDKVTALKRAIK